MPSDARHLSTPRVARRCPHPGSLIRPLGSPAAKPGIARKPRLDEDLSGGRAGTAGAAVGVVRPTLPTASMHILSTGRGEPESESQGIDLRRTAPARFRPGRLHLREALAHAGDQCREIRIHEQLYEHSPAWTKQLSY